MIPHRLIPLLILSPLLIFLLWRRFRSHFGRQPIRRQLMRTRIIALGVVGLMLASAGQHQPRLVLGLLGGAAVGAALGGIGLRLTRFELDPLKGDCYIPNPWLGVLLMALLIGRIVWRLLTAPAARHAAVAGHPPALGSSPLTMLVVGLSIGYYIVYFTGLLRHHRQLLAVRTGGGGGDGVSSPPS